MTNRLHVLNDGQRTCVIVTDEASVNAAVKRRLVEVASQAGLVVPDLISTSPIQSPKTLKQLGLEAWQPLSKAGPLQVAPTGVDELHDDLWYVVYVEADGSRTVAAYRGGYETHQLTPVALSGVMRDARAGLMKGAAIKDLCRPVRLVHTPPASGGDECLSPSLA